LSFIKESPTSKSLTVLILNLSPDTIIHSAANFNLNDISGVQEDTSVSPQSAVEQWGLDIISAQAAWNQNILGQNVTVAVLDTEVDVHHPQLQSQIAINTGEIPDNGIDDDKNGVVDDYAGAVFISKADNANDPLPDHGTHVAGIIAADPHSGSLSGVAPAAKILPAQFLSRSGSGRHPPSAGWRRGGGDGIQCSIRHLRICRDCA
jgi:subtilisin family serine protease